MSITSSPNTTSSAAEREERDRLQLRCARTMEDLAAIARLRYRVYVEEMGRTQPFADPAQQAIHEPLDEGALIVGAFLPDGSAVGTLRISSSTRSDAEAAAFYGWSERERLWPGQVCLASKLMVLRGFRGSRIALELIRAGTCRMMQQGYRFAYLDANAPLVEFYRRLGFKPLANKEHPLFGGVTIMEWDMHDLDHMRDVQSPLFEVCAQILNTRAAA